MKKKYSSKLKPCILCMMMAVVMALAIGCGDTAQKDGNSGSSQTEDAAENGSPDTWPDGSVVGEGSKEFIFTVVDQESSETKLEIHTDQETVGAALSELGIIAGDESEYGLYVKTVNGITVDYDKDGLYWALYVNDEYAQTGVDETEIVEGDSYSFKIEKA